MKYLISLLLLVSCASKDPVSLPPPTPQPEPPVVVDTTPKDEVSLEGARKVDLWSTYYYIPQYKNDPNGLPVRDMHGNPLGPKLAKKDLCNLMLQGSGVIDGQMYGYWKKTWTHRIDCSRYSSKISGRVKFRKEDTKYGTGVKMIPLTPFKSVAVDPDFIPYESRIFIPKLKGIKYIFEGKEHTHNGIVFAQDTGSAIKGNHIDFFIGPVVGGFKNTYPVAKPFTDVFVKSKSSATFEAYVLK